MSAGERRDDSSRDAPTDARETRRRYSADEVSRCGRWMQRAGGVELFPEARDERMRQLPSSRGCIARLCFGPTPSGTLLGEADCTGLDPDGVYVYAERVEGRARRPPQRASTVARNKAAHWKANQHRQATAHQHLTRSQNMQADLPRGSRVGGERGFMVLYVRSPELNSVATEVRTGAMKAVG